MVILNKNYRLLFVFVSLMLLLTQFSFASEQTTSSVKVHHSTAKQTQTTTKVASMVASPNSCVLAARAEYCQMTFYILWQTPQKGDFCLHKKQGVKPLKCWYNLDHASIKLKFFAHLLTNDEHYYLLDANGDKLIASLSVPITATLNQRQRAQRKRRGFWRMF